mgnify:CR=1 FL=1
MKLLFVLKGSALNRGMNTGIENLAWQLAEYGADVHILTGGSQPEKHGYRFPANVTYYFTGGNGMLGDHIALYKQLRHKQHFDAVIGWIRNIRPLAFLEPIGSRRPRFVANEGQTMKSAIFAGMRSRLRAFASTLIKGNHQLIKSALLRTKKINGVQIDKVVAISRAVKANVETVYSLPDDRVTVIPRGVDTEFYYLSDDKNLDTLSDPPRMLFSGNIKKTKGLGDVAEALAMVKQPVEWVLCGKDQGYLQELQANIENQDIAHRLTWAGTLYPEELRIQLQYADCFVFCSWSEVQTGGGWGEGLGKSLLEAMSCGLPVIVSNIAAFRDVVVDRENGLIVPVNDPQSIAEAINTYLNDPELRIRCGVNARKTIMRTFNKQAEATAWINLLNEQIEKGQ